MSITLSKRNKKNNLIFCLFTEKEILHQFLNLKATSINQLIIT